MNMPLPNLLNDIEENKKAEILILTKEHPE